MLNRLLNHLLIRHPVCHLHQKQYVRLLIAGVLISMLLIASGCPDRTGEPTAYSDELSVSYSAKVGQIIDNGLLQPDFSSGIDSVILTNREPEPSSRKFSQANITVACATGRMAEFLHVDGQEWARRTGAELRVVELQFNQLFEQVATDILSGSGTYDIVLYPHYLSGDIMGTGKLVQLETLMDPETINNNYAEGGLEWDSYFRNFREIYCWYDGHIYSLPVDGDIFQVAYRKDLWLQYADEFQEQYGYALRPGDPMFPETWSQYYDIAAFFNNLDDYYGTVDINIRSRASAWHFLTRYVSFLQKDDMLNGDVYFDRNTMKPLINSPAGVKAMVDSIKSVRPQYSAANAASFGWTEMQKAWHQGKTAIQFTWPAMINIARRPGSAIPGGISSTGYSVIPGSRDVYDAESGSWRQLKEPHRATILAHGWQLSLVDTCKDKEAAFDLMRWMTTGDRLIHNTQKVYWEYEPVKQWEWTDPQVIAEFQDAPSYLSSLALSHAVAVPDLRIPGAVQMYDAIEIYRSKALAGKMTAQQAVDAIAEDWEKIVKQRGLERMRKAYVDSITPHRIEEVLIGKPVVQP